MAQYYSLAYIMKTTEDVQPTFSYTPGNTGDVMLAKGPNGGFIRDANLNYDLDTDILGITGQVRTERVLFDNSGVRVGIDSGLTDQSGNAIAIGYQAGLTRQEPNSIAIGASAGLTDQSGNSIAIGYDAGSGTQGGDSIAIGSLAGKTTQNENAIAIGALAGNSQQQEGGVSVGYKAGETQQGTNSVAIGNQAGNNIQGLSSVAIGDQAGNDQQSFKAVAIGYHAGNTLQERYAVAIGDQAGKTNQYRYAVAIGAEAGLTDQSGNAVALGYQAGKTRQEPNSIAIGTSAGLTDQSGNAVAIGYDAGSTTQGGDSIAIGALAGKTNQSEYSVAIGAEAGMTDQSGNAVALGYQAGLTRQEPNSIAIGALAGLTDQSGNAVAIGYDAGSATQGGDSIAIGSLAGKTNQSEYSVAIGAEAGMTDQSGNAVAIGYQAGLTRQEPNSIAIGALSGLTDQSGNSIAIGYDAGSATQGGDSIAIGSLSGKTNQSEYSVAIGAEAGMTDQSGNAVALGYQAGQTRQEPNSIAIGSSAGLTDQSGNAIAIGYEAGNGTQGGDSIAIGSLAGYSSQAENTIILNATGAALNSVGDASACYVKPIRNVDTSYNLYEPLAYNKTTGELVSGNNVGFKMITDSFSVSGGGGSGGSSGGDDKLFAYSYDGITWEQDDSGKSVRTFTDGSCNALGYDGTVWVAGGVGESAIAYSANGITWERNNDTMRTVLDSGNWRNAVDISFDLVDSSERFASSVGLDQSGNVMAVGAYGYNSNEGNVSLYDYSMNSDSWVKTYDLSSNVAGESFGSALAITRIDATTTRIAIGAPTNTTADGKVYVYDTSYNEDTWGDRTVNLVDAAIDNIGSSEKFGSAIAMNALGTRLLIGAPENNSGEGAVYNFDLSYNVWTRHPSSNIFDGGNSNANFGHSIAINAAGNRCLIGEPNNGTGHVYSYDFSANPGYWGLTSSSVSFTADQDLSYNSTAVDASFGHVISMNDVGDWCAVGAPNAGSGRGWVGIYNYNYQLWNLYTDISGQTSIDEFGSSVEMNGVGDRLIVGAKGYNSGDGLNYVYNYNSETLAWEFERTVSSDAVGASNQGETLAIDTLGNRFVSGAPSHDSNNGTLAVYDRQMKCNALTAHGGNWIGGGNAVRVEQDTPFAYSADGITNWQAAAKGKEEAILRKELCYATSATTNNFGSRCDMNADGTRLVVGSPGATVGGTAEKGRVCIYDYDMSLNDWISEPTKVYEGGATNDFMGTGVALNAAGDILVVGIGAYDGAVTNRGSCNIYHYDLSNNEWPDSPTRYYVGDADSDFFGYSVVINARGDRIAVGAPTDDDGASNAGSVFIIDYDHDAEEWPSSDGTAASSISGVIKAYSAAANINAGTSLSFNAAGDVLAIGLPGVTAVVTGFVQIIERDNTTGEWGRPRDGTTGTNFQLAVANCYSFSNNGNNFGWKVSLNAKGDRLAVSQYTYNSNKGRVYIIDYNYSTKSWPDNVGNIETVPVKYTRYYDGPAEGASNTAAFGFSLKLNAAGDRLLIGDLSDYPIDNAGALYVIDYNAETGGWSDTSGNVISASTYIFKGDIDTDVFGSSCAMNALGNRIAVGAAYVGINTNLYSAASSDKYGTNNGYVRLYDLLTLPIQLEDCRALTTFNGNLIAGGKGNGGHIFALSNDNGVTWKNNQMNEDRLFDYDWSGNSLTFPYDKVSKFTHEFFGDTNATNQSFGFGCTINYDGTRCVIGAVRRDSSKGSLFFFHNDDGYGWKLNTQYDNPNSTGGFLGHNRSISINDAGTRVVAGAYDNDYNGENSGSLFIFDYYNGIWNAVKRIDGDAASYQLGRSCDINGVGDRIVVGAFNNAAEGFGHAYIYHLIDNDWRLMKTYSEGSTSTISTLKFGNSVAMNGVGDRVAVSNSVDSEVYIYDYVNGAWGAVHSHLFSIAGSLAFNTSGDRLIIGDSSTTNGTAYIYHYDAGSWSSVPERTYTGESSGDEFGTSGSFDASGDRVLIGASGVSAGADKGGAYLYSYDYGTSAWPATTTDYDVSFAGVSANDGFASEVALTGLGHKALIGAQMYDNTNYGRGYLYEAARSSATSDIYCNALAVKGSNEMIVAGLGGTDMTNPFAWSTDGLTWYPSNNGATIFTGSGAVCKAVAWNGSRWVAGGKSSGSGGPLAYSYNGKKWYKSMNGLTLLGAASTCNAVSWNGKYWMASVEGASGGQTQVYSNDGITWLASNNGDELFSSTSQALALVTSKEGTINSEDRMATLEGRVTTLDTSMNSVESRATTLETTQFGVGQSWSGNLNGSRAAGTTYYNNTDKLMYINVSESTSVTSGHGLYIYVDGILVGRSWSNNGERNTLSVVVPAGSSYSWAVWPTFTATIEAWYEFS
jgi:hypothetical protein